MGQKVHPTGFRLGFIDPDQVGGSYWKSYWYADKADYKKQIKYDILIRKYLDKKLKRGTVSKIFLSRKEKGFNLSLSMIRARSVLTKIEELELEISKICDGSKVSISIVEERKPDLSASIVAESVALQVEKRVSYKKAMKKAISSALQSGAKGIKIACAGRLGGAEIARAEWYREGQVPLHVIKANIDYDTARANTTYGVIGVKVWINK